MKCSSKGLLIITLLYIYLPVAIFLVGFTKLPIWILTLGIMGFFGYKLYCDYRPQEEDCIIVKPWVMAAVAGIITVICILLGFGGIFAQAGDWHKHNAVLHDLVERKWPVYYVRYEKSMLTYYLGQYMLPSLIGKIAESGREGSGFAVAEAVMAVWGIIGLVLVYINLVRITKADRVKSQLRLVFIMIFFCGALPLAQIICNEIFGNKMHSLGAHHWLLVDNLMLQYRSNMVMIRWIYPQIIVVWLITILFLENREKTRHYVLLLTPLMIFGTFSVVILGMLAVISALVTVIGSDNRKGSIADIFSLSNILSMATLGTVFITYFWGYLQVEKPAYISFKAQNLNVVSLTVVFIFDICMFGVYAVCVFEREKKNVIFYAVTAMLAVIPLFRMGLCNDWVMGTSMPGLFIIMIYVASMLNDREYVLTKRGKKSAYRYGTACALISVFLVVGAIYPVAELKDNVADFVQGNSNLSFEDNSADYYQTLETFSNRDSEESDDLIYNYYTYDLDGKFFYEYIAKNKIK